MTEQMIRDAYCKIRTIDQTIPDDVLDYMKEAAIEKLNSPNEVIQFAKMMWNETDNKSRKLDTVKFLMSKGYGLKQAHDFCKENF